MNKYINVNDLRNAMYQETFEKDSEMQKWESGCWIRYKLFENVLDAMPSADVAKVVMCKDCIHSIRNEYPIHPNYKYFCTKTSSPTYIDYHSENWFCADGERKDTK